MAQTVRVSEATHARIRDLAARLDQPLARVLDAAVREYERNLFWEQYRRDVDTLTSDAGAWAAQQAEDRLWEATSADGLDAEEVWTDADFASPEHSATR
jgi:predicted transcriptional regulator